MTERRAHGPAGRAAGFTLVELMVVLVIITLGILALSGVQVRSSRDVYGTGRRTRAVALAQTRMETSRALGFAGAASDSGQSDIFAWRTDVDSVDAGLKRLRVTVNWSEQGVPLSVQLIDLLSAR